MLTKDQVLREIPLRKRLGEYIPVKEFVELKRVIVSQKMTEADLELFRKEIIARKEKIQKDKEKKHELG